MRGDQMVLLRFTEKMQWPSNLQSVLHSKDAVQRLSFLVLKMDKDEPKVQNLKSWKAVFVDSRNIHVAVEFQDPLEISLGDEPDLLLVQVELSEYRDHLNRALPPSVVKLIELAPQTGSPDEASRLQKVGSTVFAVTNTQLMGTVVVNLLTLGSL